MAIMDKIIKIAYQYVIKAGTFKLVYNLILQIIQAVKDTINDTKSSEKND